MNKNGVDVSLVSTPENIFYLVGLDHQGYFAFHMLIVPLEGEPVLVARAMEQQTIAAQVTDATFVGFQDHENPAIMVQHQLVAANLHKSVIGLEKSSAYLTVQSAETLYMQLPQAQWVDISEWIFEIRRVQSPVEVEYTRKAIDVASTMMQAARDVAGVGITEREIAAEIYRAMVESGGDYPGFHPFVRSTPTLHQEHVTWSDRTLESGDMLFVELAGCSNRYHAPMGRLIYVDTVPQETYRIEKICRDAFQHVLETMAPGVKASDVYRAWQSVVDNSGLSHYRRHHCGYLVGIAFPPSWTGGNTVVGLREGNDFVLESGMVFHVLSWLMDTGQGDYFTSDTVIVTDKGCECPSAVSRELVIV